MTKTFSRLFILILTCLFLNPYVAQASTDNGRLTVILLVDNSGSMKTSDPSGLRFTGARLFASLLDPGDSLGLILFSTESTVLTDRMIELNTRDQVVGLLEGLNMRSPSGYTDIKSAFENAKSLLETEKHHAEKVVIVLLTDGKPEIQNPYPQYEHETLELARSMNIPVMAIALTSAAQTPFLNRLAAVTNGKVNSANDASDILDAYLKILGQVKDRTVIGGEQFTTRSILEIEPALAPYILSATFIGAKPEDTSIHLLDPDGNEISGEQIADPRFSQFTLQNPAGGVYSFRLQGGGNAQVWAILRSRLRLRILEPYNFHPMGRDMLIVVSLVEETPDQNFVIINGEVNFTALITSPDGKQTSLDRFYDDGTHGDAVAGDGMYSRLFPSPNLSGAYGILIQGWKGVVPVQTEDLVNVVKFPEFVVDEPREKIEARGKAVVLSVHLDDLHTFEEGEIVALITAPSGLTSKINLQNKENGYVGHFSPSESGTYKVLFETHGVKYLDVEYQTQIEHAFIVEIIPMVTVILENATVTSSCLIPAEEYLLRISTTSTDAGVLRFSANDWRVAPQTINLQKGNKKILLQLYPSGDEIEETYKAEIQIESSKRLEIQPEPVIKAEFQIPNFYARCRTPIKLGTIALTLAVMGVLSFKRIRNAALPPLVTGTLRHWENGGDSTVIQEIDLTSYKKHALVIGSSAACDVMILDAKLDPEHARIEAQKTLDGIEIYLEPIGEVRKGYGLQNVRFALRHGETFRMGVCEIQYLSDHGE